MDKKFEQLITNFFESYQPCKWKDLGVCKLFERLVEFYHFSLNHENLKNVRKKYEKGLILFEKYLEYTKK